MLFYPFRSVLNALRHQIGNHVFPPQPYTHSDLVLNALRHQIGNHHLVWEPIRFHLCAQRLTASDRKSHTLEHAVKTAVNECSTPYGIR